MTLAIALVGGGASAWLFRRARRDAVVDRFRTPTTRRLPPGVHRRLQGALDAAAIAMPAEHAAQLWLLAGFVTGVLTAAVDLRIAPLAVVATLAAGPLVLWALRHRQNRAVAGAIPTALERIAAELRAGGTVTTAVAWLADHGGALGADFARV